MKRIATLSILAAACFGQGGAAKLYVGAWPQRVLIVDEATGRLDGEIALKTGVARSIEATRDKKRLIVSTMKDSGIEIIDLATRQVTSSFTLSEGNKKMRPQGLALDSQGKLLYTIITPVEKKIDRFEIGKRKWAVIDIDQKKIARTVDIPPDMEQDVRGMLKLSPDGKFIYAFGQNILVFDTVDFKQVEKIDLQKPTFSQATDSLSMFGDMDRWGDPAILQSVFFRTDNVVRRTVFGLARFDLNKRTFDFQPIGPPPNQFSGVQVTPDQKTGYAISIDGQHGDRVTQFMVFDMAKQKLVKRAEFAGRTRFTFAISSDGKKLLIYGAGNTIEFYDAATLKLEKTLDVNADMTTGLVVIPPGP